MKEQMSEKKNAAWTIAFLGMILLFLTAADLLTPERTYSENENRILAKKPELTLEGVRDGSFMKDFGEYVRDQFVGRDKWVMLKTQGDILLQKKEINGVYLCKDDYLIEQHPSPGYQDEKYSKEENQPVKKAEYRIWSQGYACAYGGQYSHGKAPGLCTVL